MKELSLNILDIAENSVSAGATRVAVTVEEQDGVRTLTVEDDGRGMDKEFLARVRALLRRVNVCEVAD